MSHDKSWLDRQSHDKSGQLKANQVNLRQARHDEWDQFKANQVNLGQDRKGLDWMTDHAANSEDNNVNRGH